MLSPGAQRVGTDTPGQKKHQVRMTKWAAVCNAGESVVTL